MARASVIVVVGSLSTSRRSARMPGAMRRAVVEVEGIGRG
jgi:hypothetical protein